MRSELKHAGDEAEGESSQRDEEPNSPGCRLSRSLLIDQRSLSLGRVTWDTTAAVLLPLVSPGHCLSPEHLVNASPQL